MPAKTAQVSDDKDPGSGFDSRRLHHDHGNLDDSGAAGAQLVPSGRRIYAERPAGEAPSAPNRMRQEWARCRGCEGWFATPVREPRAFCSPRCVGDHARATGRLAGASNPRWQGGIASAPDANMRYKRRTEERYPERAAARHAVSNAVRAGRLVRQPCEVCGAATTAGHHDDYARPLEVRWLCRPCHDAHHRDSHKRKRVRSR